MKQLTNIFIFLISSINLIGQEPDTAKYQTFTIDTESLFLKSNNPGTDFIPTIQRLIKENKIGVFSDKYYLSNIEEKYPEICDSLENGIIKKKNNENYLNICIGTNLMKDFEYGLDTINNSSVYLYTYGPPKKFQFNIEDISKVEIQEIKNINKKISSKPIFISIFIKKNENEVDGFSIEISDLLNYINPSKFEYTWLYEIIKGNYGEIIKK